VVISGFFAAIKHNGQVIPGSEHLPYIVHVSNVAMEILMAFTDKQDFDLDFAVQVALLHDTLEDTSTTFEELEGRFGSEIAVAVAALSKNDALPKKERMLDCLTRIQKLRKEVRAVN